MPDNIPQLTLFDTIEQSRQRMRWMEADIRETVRRTRAVIDISRSAMAEADRRLACTA